jgi:hypothetical protein
MSPQLLRATGQHGLLATDPDHHAVRLGTSRTIRTANTNMLALTHHDTSRITNTGARTAHGVASPTIQHTSQPLIRIGSAGGTNVVRNAAPTNCAQFSKHACDRDSSRHGTALMLSLVRTLRRTPGTHPQKQPKNGKDVLLINAATDWSRTHFQRPKKGKIRASAGPKQGELGQSF